MSVTHVVPSRAIRTVTDKFDRFCFGSFFTVDRLEVEERDVLGFSIIETRALAARKDQARELIFVHVNGTA
jgi:hypothetical protein